MSEIFKTFRSGEKKITPTVTHKEWVINKENSASLGIEYTKSPSGIATSAKVTNPYSPHFGKVYNLNDSNQKAALSNAELYLSRKRDNYLSKFQGNFNLYDNMMSGSYKGHLNNPKDNYSGEYGNILKKRHEDLDNRFAKIHGAVGSDKFNQKLALANRKNMPNLFESGVTIPKFKK